MNEKRGRVEGGHGGEVGAGAGAGHLLLLLLHCCFTSTVNI